uniref:Uncharacterized protein n=1 Tax=Anopheles atroparvus TaxID=41427 RepID=A0A182IP05_ANOAO
MDRKRKTKRNVSDSGARNGYGLDENVDARSKIEELNAVIHFFSRPQLAGFKTESIPGRALPLKLPAGFAWPVPPLTVSLAKANWVLFLGPDRRLCDSVPFGFDFPLHGMVQLLLTVRRCSRMLLVTLLGAGALWASPAAISTSAAPRSSATGTPARLSGELNGSAYLPRNPARASPGPVSLVRITGDDGGNLNVEADEDDSPGRFWLGEWVGGFSALARLTATHDRGGSSADLFAVLTVRQSE